jgi:hypothetical protein
VRQEYLLSTAAVQRALSSRGASVSLRRGRRYRRTGGKELGGIYVPEQIYYQSIHAWTEYRNALQIFTDSFARQPIEPSNLSDLFFQEAKEVTWNEDTLVEVRNFNAETLNRRSQEKITSLFGSDQSSKLATFGPELENLSADAFILHILSSFRDEGRAFIPAATGGFEILSLINEAKGHLDLQCIFDILQQAKESVLQADRGRSLPSHEEQYLGSLEVRLNALADSLRLNRESKSISD